MTSKNRLPNTGTMLLLVSCIILYACEAPPASSTRPSNQIRSDQTVQDNLGDEPVSVVYDARPVALVEGQGIYWNDIKPALGELAGGEALQEAILDLRLAQELEQKSLRITESDVTRERELLVNNLDEDLNQALRLLDDLREKQKLGPSRFAALLRRNASLRMLIQDEVQVTEASLQHTFDLFYGVMYQCRVLMSPTLADAEAALRRIENGESFADVALELSTDPSAVRGGLLEPISPVDQNYPEALRQAIGALAPGEISAPVLIDDQIALVQLVRIHESQAIDFEGTRTELVRLTRQGQERLLMERLARRLMRNITISFFDKSIEDSFRAVRRAGNGLINP